MHAVTRPAYEDEAVPAGAAAETVSRVPPPKIAAVAAAPARPSVPAAAVTRAAAWLATAIPKLLWAMVSIGLFIGAWHLATEYRLDFYIRFVNVPGPTEVLGNFSDMLNTSRYYEHVWFSMQRILIGFSIATVLGVLLGLLIGQYRPVRNLLFPIFEVLRPIPAIAWVPMAVMLWPTNETSIVFITFLGSFFPILLNTIHGVGSVDPVLVRAGRCLGAGEAALLRQVILPAALPHIFTGLAIGMGVAWVSLIAAEMISGQFGVGYFTWEAYSLIEYADIVVGMITIGVLGLACSGAIRLVGNLLMPWLPASAGGGKS